MDVSARIKELLNLKKATQKELADYLSCSPVFISNVLHGLNTMSLDRLQQTCDFFGITLADFFAKNSDTPAYIRDFNAFIAGMTEAEITLLKNIGEMLPTHLSKKN